MTDPILLGAIEAGGTKFLCAVANRDGKTIAETRIATTIPAVTMAGVAGFFAACTSEHGPLSSLGIGSFGPLSLDPKAGDYGCITSTPKPEWENTDMLGPLAGFVDGPVALDTDVNAAAIGEHLFGSGRGADSICYVTVGTGIGVGVLIGGAPHGGANHPEAGHIPVPRAGGDDDFAGICPFHGDCLEGLASGPAMQARWGQPAETLPADHAAWGIEADYIASLCASLSYIVRPDRIVLGGGVMEMPDMHRRVRGALRARIAGYDASLGALDMESYVARPAAGGAVGRSAGLTGALAMAYRGRFGGWPDWKMT